MNIAFIGIGQVGSALAGKKAFLSLCSLCLCGFKSEKLLGFRYFIGCLNGGRARRKNPFDGKAVTTLTIRDILFKGWFSARKTLHNNT